MTTAEASALLVALQECREAAAAAMRVLVRHALTEAFTAELARCGVREGFGARADRAIAGVMPHYGDPERGDYTDPDDE